MRKADYLPQPVRGDSSGLTFFDGEDHDELDRKRRFQEEQRAYLLMQMEQNKQKKELEHKQNMLYDKQRLAVMDQTNENNRTFQEQNLFMSRATQ